MDFYSIMAGICQFILDKGPALLLLGQIIGVYMLMLFGHYKGAVLLVISAALTLLLGW